MKKILMFLGLIYLSMNITCKKEELICGDYEVGEAYLMHESKQLIMQYIGRKLTFKDSNGIDTIFEAKDYLYTNNDKSLLRVRCISPNNFWVDLGDYIKTDRVDIKFANGIYSYDLRAIVISSGLPPDTLHYDIVVVSNITSLYPVLIPLSKRGISSKRDLNLGNRFIGDTTLLGKPFHNVSKNHYEVKFNFYITKLIKNINISSVTVKEDVYFTPEQGVVAFRKNGKLWVLTQ